MISFLKKFFSSHEVTFDDISDKDLSEKTNQQLIYYLENYVLTLGEGNRVVLQILKNLIDIKKND